MGPGKDFEYSLVIDKICGMQWQTLTADEMISAAWAYYYFSVQFRESLEIARSLYPQDAKLKRLEEEECDTDNLSPWPGVAQQGEKINHDEYMRRTLDLVSIDKGMSLYFASVGQSYLAGTRKLDRVARAASIASYEDGGLERVFRAILRFSRWDNALLQSFEHFLVEHVKFDGDPEQGHGALSRHITVDDSVLPLWEGFHDLLVTCVPGLIRKTDAGAIEGHELDGGHGQGFPLGVERLDTGNRPYPGLPGPSVSSPTDPI